MTLFKLGYEPDGSLHDDLRVVVGSFEGPADSYYLALDPLLRAGESLEALDEARSQLNVRAGLEGLMGRGLPDYARSDLIKRPTWHTTGRTNGSVPYAARRGVLLWN